MATDHCLEMPWLRIIGTFVRTLDTAARVGVKVWLSRLVQAIVSGEELLVTASNCSEALMCPRISLTRPLFSLGGRFTKSTLKRHVGPDLMAIVLLLGSLTTACNRQLQPEAPEDPTSRFVIPEQSDSAPRRDAATVIIFIHGVFGKPLSTWKRQGDYPALWTVALESAGRRGKYDAFVFGYPTNVFASGSFSITEAAVALDEAVKKEQLARKYRRLVLVGHSMGGLVALHTLVTADWRDSVPLVVTFGTPYEGSQIADIGRYVIGNAGIAAMTAGEGNSFLEGLRHQWSVISDKGRIKVRCGYEKLNYGALGRTIVGPMSAKDLCNGASLAINDDHVGIAKPDGLSHASVTVLGNALDELEPVAPLTELERTMLVGCNQGGMEFLSPSGAAAVAGVLRIRGVVRTASKCKEDLGVRDVILSYDCGWPNAGPTWRSFPQPATRTPTDVGDIAVEAELPMQGLRDGRDSTVPAGTACQIMANVLYGRTVQRPANNPVPNFAGFTPAQ